MTTTCADKLDDVLRAILGSGGKVSDINLSVGRPPQMESDGRLQPLAGAAALTPQDTERWTRTLLADDDRLWAELDATGACDLAWALARGPRLRVNVFKTAGNLALVLRVLASEVPSLERMDLPPAIGDICKLANGLVLVTGSTGSGKSTTLAAIIDGINRTRAVHVVTLEDPIEFRHPHRLGTVNQRELGRDFATFADGLKAALRQAPKVILLGEMRDRETVEIALKAAETGHLVLSTMHTIDAGQTILRITGLFEAAEQRAVRARLAQTLRVVVGQRLLPRADGGRVAALEIMGNSLQVRELIQEGERDNRTFADVIGGGVRNGWQTFDQHIARHYTGGAITEEVALTYCSDRAVLRRAIDEAKSGRGEDTSDIGSLEMERMPRRK